MKKASNGKEDEHEGRKKEQEGPINVEKQENGRVSCTFK